MVAREIAKTSWIDFRPFSEGPDPVDAAQFEKRYPVVAPLKAQLHNVKHKGMNKEIKLTLHLLMLTFSVLVGFRWDLANRV